MFKILDFTKDNLTALQVEGTVTKEDYEKLNALFEKNKREYDKQKLYFEIHKLRF